MASTHTGEDHTFHFALATSRAKDNRIPPKGFRIGEAAARLARRHLRDLRLPDSAIDVLDEAGAMLRLNPPEDGRKIVDVAEVEKVVARMARIPETQATTSDRERLRTLGDALKRVVFGQAEAVDTVASAIKRARAGLGPPERPAGAFLFTGPTGVGKTEIARRLARLADAPFVNVEASKFTEVGYVGRDVESMVRDMVEIAIEISPSGNWIRRVATAIHEMLNSPVREARLRSIRMPTLATPRLSTTGR